MLILGFRILIEEVIRDIGSLESALARSFATFDNIELYPNPIKKVAAILESIVINHPL